MARWMSGRAVLHLRRVGVAGKPVGVAVRWYVHRPGFGVQGHLPPTAYLRGRAGNNMHRECHITPVAGGPAAGVPTRGGGEHRAHRRALAGIHSSGVAGGGRSHSPEPIAP
jgi:hypothetical protein